VRLYIRSSLQETEAFRRRTHHPRLPEAARALVANWQIVVLGMLLVAMTTVPFSFVTRGFTPVVSICLIAQTGDRASPRFLADLRGPLRGDCDAAHLSGELRRAACEPRGAAGLAS
jgi:hypothetical protein